MEALTAFAQTVLAPAPSVRLAERERFELSMGRTTHNGFRDRRLQPLGHLS